MSLEQIIRWDPNLVVIPVLTLGIGITLSFGLFVMLKNRVVLRWSLMCPIVAVVTFNYYLAYRCIVDIMTKFAQFDLILPLYGLVALTMLPFTINLLKLAWSGVSKLASTKLPTANEVAINRVLEKLEDCERIGIITREALELCRAHLSGRSEE
jgi:hypothetical protein